RDPQALVLRGHSRAVAGAAFSPGGSRLVTAGADDTLNSWDLASGRALSSIRLSLNVSREGVRVSFSPGGVYLAASAPGNVVKVWEAATGRELPSLRGHTDAVSDRAFSADGKRLATASHDKTV